MIEICSVKKTGAINMDHTNPTLCPAPHEQPTNVLISNIKATVVIKVTQEYFH